MQKLSDTQKQKDDAQSVQGLCQQITTSLNAIRGFLPKPQLLNKQIVQHVLQFILPQNQQNQEIQPNQQNDKTLTTQESTFVIKHLSKISDAVIHLLCDGSNQQEAVKAVHDFLQSAYISQLTNSQAQYPQITNFKYKEQSDINHQHKLTQLLLESFNTKGNTALIAANICIVSKTPQVYDLTGWQAKELGEYFGTTIWIPQEIGDIANKFSNKPDQSFEFYIYLSDLAQPLGLNPLQIDILSVLAATAFK